MHKWSGLFSVGRGEQQGQGSSTSNEGFQTRDFFFCKLLLLMERSWMGHAGNVEQLQWLLLHLHLGHLAGALSKATYVCVLYTHSHTDCGVNHARRQPAGLEQ